MSALIVDDFLQPLLELFAKPKGSVAALAEALAEDCPSVTRHQLREAVRALRQSWKYASFPTPAACIAAIRSAPLHEIAPRSAAVAERPRGDPPVLIWARRYAADYDAAGVVARDRMDRRYPGRHAAALAVLAAYGE